MIRKSQMVKSLILTACFLAVAITLKAEQETNPMHPAFKLLDARGEVIQQEGKEPDQIRTCGQCHSAAFVSEHNLPAHQQRKIACLSCHYEGGKANWNSGAFESNGTIKREWIRISKPSISNCGGCHGLTGTPGGTVSIPEDYRAAAYPSGRPGIGTVPIDPFRRFDILSRGSRDLFSQFIRQTRSPVPLGRSRPEIIAVHRLPLRPQ